MVAMGHREELLEGAKQCLYEKGYARTTARDIVATSGTNLGSIGYHYGSKEALLDAALLDAITEMSAALLRLTESEHSRGDLASAWQRMIEEFDSYRPLLIAQVEAWAQAKRSPELEERLAAFRRDEIAQGVDELRALYPSVDEPTARAATTVIGLLADGLSVHWLIDPDSAPNGQQIATGLRTLADLIEQPSNAETATKPHPKEPKERGA